MSEQRVHPTWLFYLGVGVECAIDLLGVVVGIVSPDARNVIGGAAVRLALFLLLAFYVRRGKENARTVLFAIETITSLSGIGGAVIFGATFTTGRLKAVAGALAITIVYGAIAFAIHKGKRRDPINV